MESGSNDRMRQQGSGERVVFKPPSLPPRCDGNWGSSVTVSSKQKLHKQSQFNSTPPCLHSPHLLNARGNLRVEIYLCVHVQISLFSRSHTGCGRWARFLPGMSLWTPENAVDTTRLSPPLDNYRNPDNIYDTHHHCHPGHSRAVRSFSFIRDFLR